MRVLVARLDNHGDVLLAGPAIRAVAARADEVVLLCGPRGRAAAELLPGVDRLIEWRAPWIDPEPDPVDPGHIDELLKQIDGTARAGGAPGGVGGRPPSGNTARAGGAPGDAGGRPPSGGIDRALILTSFHQSPLPLALLLRLAGVRWIGGISEDYPGSLLDLRHRPDVDVPEAVRMLALARDAGFPPPAGDHGKPAVRRPLPDMTALTGPPGYVVAHPGTSVPARAWPPGHWAEAVRLLGAAGHRVMVTGAPAERVLTARVANSGARDLGGRTGFRELAGVLAGAAVVIAANTGPAHLAAAVGTPVVSLFAPTVPAARWAPYGVPAVVLGDQWAPCRDTRARECPISGHPCLTEVAPWEVATAADRLIEETQEAVA